MEWNIWTVKIWLCGVKVIEAMVRHDVKAHELQRARAAGSEPQAAAAAAGAHTAEDERAQTQARAAAEEVALDVVSLTEWYRTKSHVRDAVRVARSAMKRGLDDDEADEIRQWLRERKRCNTSEPDAKELSDADREVIAWVERRGNG